MTVEKEKYIELWNAKNLSILQSWQWGEVKSASWKIERLIIDDYPITLHLRKLPITNKYFGYIPRAFLGGVDKSIIEKLCEEAKSLNLSHIIIDPQLEDNHEFLSSGFIERGKTIQPKQTNIVDLTKSEDDLWMSLKGQYRRNIKKSIRDGCEFESLSDGQEAVERFYDVMKVIFQRTSYVMHGIDYFKKVWEELSASGKARIFMAKNKGKDVGAYLVAYDNNYAYEFYGGVTNEGRDVEAGYFLKWQAILESKAMGKSHYDHWGIAPFDENGYDKSDELYNISKFKEGFGGNLVKYSPQLVYVVNKPNYLLYSAGEKINKLILQFKKKFN